MRILAGQYFDQETGLHYNGARYYDPRIGRYISSGPIGLRGGLNTYLYARANPLRYIDPDGLADSGIYSRPLAHFPDAPGTPRHWNVCDKDKCTGFFDDSTTRTDTNPNAPGTLLLSLTDKQTNCMKYWMKSCQDSWYDFLGHNCQQCIFYSGILCGVPNMPNPQVGPFPNFYPAPRKR
jgi:RHS repeat-associated protein